MAAYAALFFERKREFMGKAPGRVMGIDFGMRHIGVAVSDELRVIARGIETVNWNGEDPEWALNRICEIIKEMEVNAIVLGMPARTDGTRSATQDKGFWSRTCQEVRH